MTLLHLSSAEPSEVEVDRALEVFEAEYRRAFPRAGDAQDHHEAQWHAMAAVLAHSKEHTDA